MTEERMIIENENCYEDENNFLKYIKCIIHDDIMNELIRDSKYCEMIMDTFKDKICGKCLVISTCKRDFDSLCDDAQEGLSNNIVIDLGAENIILSYRNSNKKVYVENDFDLILV